jgi:hypothetical protein
MKLKQALIGKSGNVRKPDDVFKKCPECGHDDLAHCESDVMCLSVHCNWNSIEVYADALMEVRCEEQKKQTEGVSKNRKTRSLLSRSSISIVA